MKRAIVLVLDSFGIGASRDADKFDNVGADTLGHIATWCANNRTSGDNKGPIYLPNLTRLGLMHAAKESSGSFPLGTDESISVTGAYAHAEEISSGKDTSSGHWEMAGVPVLFDWGYFHDKQNSFPESLLTAFIEQAGLPGVLGNCHASGTEIIARYGEEHIRTGKPIVYTSADSVFQIACHEEAFGLERLLEISQVAFSLLGQYKIARVIARPFVGDKESGFTRTGNRRDLSVSPPSPTVLDKLCEASGRVLAVGKISDIFAGNGISQKYKATGLKELVDVTMQAMRDAGDQSLVFTNFVDFDSEFGHRRDVAGYANALEYFDRRLPEVVALMQEGDVLILTADHGCDPTWPGSDHTRENVPVLVYRHSIKPGSLGLRDTFADIGQSLCKHFDLSPVEYGRSFL